MREKIKSEITAKSDREDNCLRIPIFWNLEDKYVRTLIFLQFLPLPHKVATNYSDRFFHLLS